MAAIRADPQILKEHLIMEATIDTSCVNVAMRFVALNDSSWHFLEATVGAFDKDYKVFSQHSSAHLKSRATKKTMGSTKVYNRGRVVRRFDPLFGSFCIGGNELSMNINQVKKLAKIVRIKKLAMKNNKVYVCTMKKTSMHYRMAFPKAPTDDYLSNNMYGQQARKVFIQHPQDNLEVFLERMKDGRSIIHMQWPKVAKTFNINEGTIFAFRFSSFLDQIHLSIYLL
ncbi:Casein kinase I isoform delta-like protein [Hordeum vulgare]|nr:Casein kinase I isoform delta-like protein [Hordeum vulgare]